MSNKMLSRAFIAETGSSCRKLVLAKLADQANDDGACWPSYRTIALAAECSRRQVMRHLKELEKQGFLRITRRAYRATDGQRQNQSNVYQVCLGLNGEPMAADQEESNEAETDEGWCHECHQGGVTGVTQNPQGNHSPTQGDGGEGESLGYAHAGFASQAIRDAAERLGAYALRKRVPPNPAKGQTAEAPARRKPPSTAAQAAEQVDDDEEPW